MTVRFRHAASGDLEQLTDLRWRLKTDDGVDFDVAKKTKFKANFVAAAVHGDPNTFHFAAENEGRIVGAMTVRKVEKIPAPDQLAAFWGYLTNCYVLPDFRDSGAGSGLLDFVIGWATQANLELLVVWPSDRAYPFYERRGFARPADPLVLNLTDV